MEKRIASFKDLRIWQSGMRLVEVVYKLTRAFPSHELWGLSSQMRRASVGVPSNIAEGFRRKHIKEYKQFLSISLGSCGEIETQLEIAKRLNYIEENSYRETLKIIESLCRMMHVLIRKINLSQDRRPKTHDKGGI